MNLDSRVFVAGHTGLLGGALLRRLQEQGYSNLIATDRSQLDLRSQSDVEAFFADTKSEVLFLTAARVGGIKANVDDPAGFLYDNLMIEANLLHAAAKNGCGTIVMVGSSCIYPRECPQPMKEEFLLTGPLEPTNEGYALAKIAGIRLAQYLARTSPIRVLCPIPCNLYGRSNSFDPDHSHVLAALVRKFVDAADSGSDVTLWGTGAAMREFLHVEDCADALLFLLESYHSPEIINVGSGVDVSIRSLAAHVAEKVNFQGEVHWDTSMPDGMPRKLLDVSRLKELGWEPKISLSEGIGDVIAAYRELRSARV